VFLPKIDSFASIAAFADNGHVCFPSNERNQSFADNAMIVGNEHSYLRPFVTRLTYKAKSLRLNFVDDRQPIQSQTTA